MSEEHMPLIAEFIDRALKGDNPETLKAEVKAFASQFPLP
jgi:glycine hydroxymethyltransferase